MAKRITSGVKAMRGQTIGDRLRQVREDFGLPQQKMAELLGMPYGTYQAYEQDRHEQKAAVLGRLVERGIDLNWLIAGDGSMHRSHGPAEAAGPYAGHDPKGIVFKEDLLKVVVSEIEHVLDEADAELTPDKKAEVVVAVYELALEQEGADRPVDRKKVIRLIRLAG